MRHRRGQSGRRGRQLAANARNQASKSRTLREAENSEQHSADQVNRRRRREEISHARQVVALAQPSIRHVYLHEPERLRVLRFAGVALVPDRPGFRGPTLVAGTLPAHAKFARPFVHAAGGLDVTKTEWTVPPGNYRLYLIAHGRPVTVTLRLRGLTGAATRRPVAAARAALAVPAPTVTSGPAGLVYSAGADIDMPGPALFLSIGYLRHDLPHVVSAYELCEYGRRPSFPQPYAPGCPSVSSERGTVVLVFDQQVITGTLKLAMLAASPVPAVVGGSGGSWITATPGAATGYFHYSLAL